MKSKVTLINIISSLTLQVVTVISGFIIPKIILTNFGSSVNELKFEECKASRQGLYRKPCFPAPSE